MKRMKTHSRTYCPMSLGIKRILIALLLLSSIASAAILVSATCEEVEQPYIMVVGDDGLPLMALDNNGDMHVYLDSENIHWEYEGTIYNGSQSSDSFIIMGTDNNPMFKLNKYGLWATGDWYQNMWDVLWWEPDPELDTAGDNNWIYYMHDHWIEASEEHGRIQIGAKFDGDGDVIDADGERNVYLFGEYCEMGRAEGPLIECTPSDPIGARCGGGIKYAQGYVVQEAGCGLIPGCNCIDCYVDYCVGLDYYVQSFASLPTVAMSWGLPYPYLPNSTTDGEFNSILLAGQSFVIFGCSFDPQYPAALYCDGFDKYGFGDWYLPAIDELTQLYDAKGSIDGGFGLASYWSSTANIVEDDGDYYNEFAQSINFALGFINVSKYTPAQLPSHVRCIRKYGD